MIVKKVLLRSGLSCKQWCCISRVSSLHTCDETSHEISSVADPPTNANINNNNNSNNEKTGNNILLKRISPLGNTKCSITPILDQWLQQQTTTVDQSELRNTIVRLRQFKHFNHALQLSEWMSNNQFEVTPGDVAIRLNLISKVHGIQQAEEYFNDISKNLRNFKAYGALLSCYADEKSLEKAEATMQKIRELGFTKNQLPYNVMLNLYFQTGKREKLDNLVQEFEEKGIGYDNFTYSILMNTYATSSNISLLDNLLLKMEADLSVTVDWNVYAVATNGYIIAGQMDKALVTAKKLEKLIKYKTWRLGHEFLLTLYARIGNKDEVYRVWKIIKKTKKVRNSTYLTMMSSLSKLDDIDGVWKIFGDWETYNNNYDYRIPNFLVTTYCKKGLLEDAELVIKRLIESHRKPASRTWDRLATGYHRYGQMEKAVDALKKALLASKPGGYKPCLQVLMGCLDYLEGQGDDGMAEFRTLLEEHGHSMNDIRDRIEKHTTGGGTQSSSVDDHDQPLENN